MATVWRPLLLEQPSLAGLKRRLEEVDVGQREALAEFSLAMAGADGVIDPGELKTLRKIYELLGLDSERVYADVHSMRADAGSRPAEAPVSVRPASTTTAGTPIPPPPEASVEKSAPEATPVVELDMQRVERTLSNTAEVSSLLAEVFADEANDAPETVASAESVAQLAGLDAGHAALLRALGSHESLSRDTFEGMAADLGLLADGAYEVLNEAAFERVDAPLFLGDDPIEIDHEVLGEMTT